MKSKLISIIVLLAACAVGTGYAADQAAPQEENVIDLQIVVERIKVKLQVGATSEDDLKVEFKRLDAIAAADRALAGEIAYFKGTLQMEAFNNPTKAEVYFNQVLLVSKDPEMKKQVEDVLSAIAKQRDADRIQAALKSGTEVPDFQVKELGGRKISLSKFRGLVVVLDFWATWCGPCVEDMPKLVDLNNKYQKKGLQIIGVSLDEKEDDVKAFIKKNGMFWPQIYDGKVWNAELAQKFGVTSIPFTLLIDREGKIVAKGLTGAELEAAVKKLYAK